MEDVDEDEDDELVEDDKSVITTAEDGAGLEAGLEAGPEAGPEVEPTIVPEWLHELESAFFLDVSSIFFIGEFWGATDDDDDGVGLTVVGALVVFVGPTLIWTTLSPLMMSTGGEESFWVCSTSG